MKKITAVILAGVLAVSILCACGSEEKTEETQVEILEETAAEAEEASGLSKKNNADAEEVDKSMGAMVDDETFESLQESYEVVQNLYNTVVDFYNQDYVEGDASVENSLNDIKETLTTIGDKDQASLTMQDAMDLVQTLDQYVDELDKIIDKLQAIDAGDAQVDDETFAILQDNYSDLVDVYNSIIDAYNSGLLRQSSEATQVLDSIKSLITIIGNLEQDGMTMNDALDYQQDMLDAMDYLNELLDYM